VQLTLHSDYAFRTLIYLGTHPEQMVSTREISQAYGISKHHLVRVIQTLAAHGYVEVVPGRSGGVRLARDPASIRLGDVLQQTEPNLRLVECFDAATNTCPISRCCGLKSLLADALVAFVASLNQHTLGDLLNGERRQTLLVKFRTLRAV